MKSLRYAGVLACFILFLSAGASAQVPLNPLAVNVADLPAAAVVTGKVYVVKDAMTAGSCTVGGGSARSWCQSNGTSWVAVGDGGVPITRALTAGAGLTGGGDLSSDRTFTVGAGTGIAVNADDVALDTAHVRNVDHSAVSVIAGAGLTGGGTIESTRTVNVIAGAGITVNADDVALTTPGTLTVGTTNAASGNHTHAITSSSNPGAVASLLASKSDGSLSLPRLNITDGGTLVLKKTGTNRDVSFTNGSASDNLALMAARPSSGTNVLSILAIMPLGTGAYGLRSIFSLYGTDYVADIANAERLQMAADGSSYLIYSDILGTGTRRPINIYASGTPNQLYLGITGNNGMGTATPRKKLDILSTSQAQLRLTYTDNAVFTDFLTDASGNLTITPTGPLFNLPTTVRLQSSNYVSQTTGWGIGGDGSADFRYLFTDELRAKVFTADLESVLAGSQRVTKSFSTISQTFTCPAAGSTSTLWVADAPTFGDAAVFVSGDAVVIRNMSRVAFGPFTITDCVGVVTSYADGSGANAGQQSWTFTRNSGGNAGSMTAATQVAVKQLAQDLGTTGNGYVETSAVDGAAGVNAPYTQVVTWATAPVDANLTVRTRFGNLKGITGTTEYGLIAGTYSASNGAYLRASDQSFDLHGITAKWWAGSSNVVTIAPGGGSPYLGIGNGPPTSCCTTAGIFLGWDNAASKAKASFYSDANNFFTFDGTKLTWKAANTTLDASGNLTASNATLSGTITATLGAIGGFDIGSDYVRDAANSFGLASTVTGGDDVRFWAGNTFANRATAPFRLTEAGAFTATNATITGAITASSGSITGPLTLSGSSGSIAFGTTPPTSATVGSGIWLDRNGLVALAANVQLVKLSSSGLSFPISGDIQSGSPGAMIIRALGQSGTIDAGVWLRSVNFGDTASLDFQLLTIGTITRVNIQPITGTFQGFVIGAGGSANATLDVRGTGTFTGGVTLGSPTGGNKGAGTLNAVAVYDDNVLLTDWVFGQGKPDKPALHKRLFGLDETLRVTQTEHRLPWMPARSEFESERHIGGMITRLWQGQEQQQLYIFELEERIRRLEKKGNQ